MLWMPLSMSSGQGITGGRAATWLAGSLAKVVAGKLSDVGAAVQQLTEILQPGPLEGRAGRWEHTRRAAANRAVLQAVSNFQALQHRRQQTAIVTSVKKSGAALSPPAAAQAASPSSEGLAARATTDMVLRSPGNSLFGKPGTIFFPRWMFGQWEVRARYASFRAPLGDAFVPPPILRAARATPAAGGVGSEYAYSARWFSTLPNTWSNNTKVWLGLGVPNDAVVPDRAYNLRSLTNAAAGWECVASVTYDPRDAPDRQTVEFARLTPDMQPLPPRKAEVYINNSRFAEEAPDVFVTSELFRQVMLRVRAIDVSDYEVITVYRLFAPGHVSAVQRTAVYLDPREPRYFEAGGRAVAVTDTLLDMVRDPAPVDAVGADACVLTPKDVVQCV